MSTYPASPVVLDVLGTLDPADLAAAPSGFVELGAASGIRPGERVAAIL